MSEAELKTAKIKRGYSRSAVTKKLKFISSYIKDEENIDLGELMGNVKTLNTLSIQLKSLDSMIFDTMVSLGKSEQDLEKEFDDCLAYQDDCNGMTEKVKVIEDQIKNAQVSSLSNRSLLSSDLTPSKVVKLPQLKLPNFKGGFNEFTCFWDQFNAAVGSSEHLSDVQKFSYLKGCLEGPALMLIEHLPITEASYKVAISSLKQAYSNTILNTLTLLNKLHDLNLVDSKIDSLMNFRASYENILGNLSQLDVVVEGNDTAETIMIGTILSKLPEFLKTNIHRKTGDKLLSLKEFRSAFQTELDVIASKTLTRKSNPRPVESKVKEKVESFSGDNLASSTSSMSVGVSQNKSKPVKNQKFKCYLCDSTNHTSKFCNVYSTVEARKKRILELPNRCNNCGIKVHDGPCPTLNCNNCKLNHWTPLCPQLKVNSSTNLVAGINCNSEYVALPTLDLSIKSAANNKYYPVATVIDSCSMKTLILRDIADKLCLPQVGVTEDISFSGIGGNINSCRYKEVKLSFIRNNSLFDIKAVVVDNLPSINPGPVLEKVNKLSSTYVMAPYSKRKVSLLIGNDHYFDVVDPNKIAIRCDTHWLVPTYCGYVVSGKIKYHSNTVSTNILTVLRLCVDSKEETPLLDSTKTNLPIDIDYLWQLENIGINSNIHDLSDDLVLKEFNSRITYNESLKKYTVKLPWKESVDKLLPSNFGLARGRLNGLVKRLRNDPDLVKHYNNILIEQENRNFIEKVHSSVLNEENTHYLSHHPIIRIHPTTPVRIVFDCSAKLSKEDRSLNDCLHSGPSLVPELVKILLRFRCGRYICTSDISKAFLQVNLADEDKDFLRFLWPIDINGSVYNPSNLIVYRFRVVMFGACASPFLLQATILYHMKRYSEINNFDTSPLYRNLYVDNLLGCYNSEEELLTFYENALKCYGSAGLPLVEWCSNSSKLNTIIKSDGIGPKEDKESIKMLGLKWNKNLDLIKLNPIKKESELKVTKRIVVSTSSSNFDPLGIITPVQIQSKIFIQKLWRLKYNWDDVLPDELVEIWNKILKHLIFHSDISIPRNIFYLNIAILHVFADASCEAYGCCAYVVNCETSNLLISKSRVSPLKEMTIPKMELVAILLAVRLSRFIVNTFIQEIVFEHIYFWSDSTCALSWVVNPKEHKNIFVRNRVLEIISICKNLPCNQFNYLKTDSNPADLLTRFNLKLDLHDNDLWFHGPSWLVNRDKWPQTFKFDSLNEESCLVINRNDSKCLDENFDWLPKLTKFSSYMKFLRVTCYILKFISKLKHEQFDLRINSNDINQAELIWIKTIQKLYYGDIINYFQSKDNKTKVPSLVKQLNLIFDNELIKVKTRLEHSDFSKNVIFPILLPSTSLFTKLLVEYLHIKGLHASVSRLMVIVREQFWVPRCRQVLSKIVHNCITCRKYSSRFKYAIPPSPSLPSCRINSSRAFQFSGVDYTGAILVKNHGITYKSYICLFTCATTRAIHLEISEDNSMTAFAMSFKRFVARRGLPQIMMSDNAPNFCSHVNLLNEFYNSSIGNEFLNENRIEWKFIPAKAPWFGFWESMIGVTKRILKTVLGKAMVNSVQLHTIVTDIESKINDRPLSYVSSAELEYITPSELIVGHRLNSMPIPEEFTIDSWDDDFINKHLTKTMILIKDAWTKWKKDYLLFLKNQEKLMYPCKSGNIIPKVGDIVLLIDEGSPSTWNMAKLLEILDSSDSYERVARLRTKNGIVFRSLSKLHYLESSLNNSENVDRPNSDEGVSDLSTSEPAIDVNIRPRRAAAQKMISKLSDWKSSNLV